MKNKYQLFCFLKQMKDNIKERREKRKEETRSWVMELINRPWSDDEVLEFNKQMMQVANISSGYDIKVIDYLDEVGCKRAFFKQHDEYFSPLEKDKIAIQLSEGLTSRVRK